MVLPLRWRFRLNLLCLFVPFSTRTEKVEVVLFILKIEVGQMLVVPAAMPVHTSFAGVT